MIYGDGEEDLACYTYSSFNVRDDNDDEALITQRQFKVLIEKLDSLISSSRDFSYEACSKAAVEAFFHSLIKEHQANLDKANQVVSNSPALCGAMATKMEALISDAKKFITKFQSSAGSNTLMANEAIVGLNTILQREKEALAQAHTELQNENDNFKASISAKITKLSECLAAKNNLMDQLAAHNTTIKVHKAKLNQTTKEIKGLQSERAVVKSCVGYVHALLSNILDSHDPILIISIRRHLVDKFRPAIAMLIKPILSVMPKVKSESEPKGKVNIFSDNPIIDNNEAKEPDEEELKRRKAREAEIDGH
ncbi:unnamed protein product [Lactuca saligna]|uniref:Uncharacterized protein n=1 Tax=Lactuca saligna TaxID=75948 RepID=A0AA35Z4B7_LACSI|nr:unnamed protein product [Lactuca saligna]